jgi:hypothetical protein
LALGKTLSEVLALSEAEVSVWLAHRNRRGFPHERLAHGIANAGAYVGATWGGKAQPAELLLRLQRPARPEDLAAVKAWFEARAAKGGEQ